MHSVCMMQLKFCDGYSRSRMYDARTGHLWTNKAILGVGFNYKLPNASFPKIVAVSLHHKYNWIQCVRIWWLSWRFLTNLGFVQVCALKTLGLSTGRLYLEIDITLQIHLMQVKAWYEKEWMETSKSSIYPTSSEHLVPLASQNWSCLGPDSSLTFSPSSILNFVIISILMSAFLTDFYYCQHYNH